MEGDLTWLQALFDRGYDGAGEDLRRIITPARRIPAGRLTLARRPDPGRGPGHRGREASGRPGRLAVLQGPLLLSR